MANRSAGSKLSLLLLLAGGCASSSVATLSSGPTPRDRGFGPSAGGANSGGSSPVAAVDDAVWFPIDGSFDAVLTATSVMQAMGPASEAHSPVSPAFRIDFINPPAATLASPNAWQGQAVVTPRWGAPSLFVATLSKNEISLTGSTAVPNATAGATDYYSKIVLTRNDNGDVASVLHAYGQRRTQASNDTSYNGMLASIGSFLPDKTPPEARFESDGSLGASDGRRLPWEPLTLTFAEPVILDAANALRVDPMPLHWSQGPAIEGTGASGIAKLVGVRTEWAGQSTSVFLQGPYRDTRGNPGAAVGPMTFPFVTVPLQASPSVSFDHTGVGYFTWGSAKQIPSCGSGVAGCLQLGPFTDATCDVLSSGIALRLAPMGASRIELRVKVLYQNDPGHVGNLLPLTVQAAAPGFLPTSASLAKVKPVLSAVDPAEAGGFTFGSDWTTLTMDIDPSQSPNDYGVAVRTGSASAATACAEGGDVGSVSAAVWIASITATSPTTAN